jgi:hypothetical protein
MINQAMRGHYASRRNQQPEHNEQYGAYTEPGEDKVRWQLMHNVSTHGTLEPTSSWKETLPLQLIGCNGVFTPLLPVSDQLHLTP